MCHVYESDNYAEVWDETEHTARKEHRCSSCFAVIMPGERYKTHFSVFGSVSLKEKCCLDCHAVRVAFAKAHDDIGDVPSGLPQLLANCIADEPESEAQWGPPLRRIRDSQAGNPKAKTPEPTGGPQSARDLLIMMGGDLLNMANKARELAESYPSTSNGGE